MPSAPSSWCQSRSVTRDTAATAAHRWQSRPHRQRHKQFKLLEASWQQSTRLDSNEINSRILISPALPRNFPVFVQPGSLAHISRRSDGREEQNNDQHPHLKYFILCLSARIRLTSDREAMVYQSSHVQRIEIEFWKTKFNLRQGRHIRSEIPACLPKIFVMWEG